MAISVISPAALDSKGLSSLSDFVGELPSVNMQSVSPGENVIDMRGLVSSEVNPTNAQQRSLVALYLDDASIGQEGFNPDLHVYDLERIEVIRGPQGTLYGAGSMAGTIRLITKKPDLTAFSGDADVSVSETRHGGTNTSERAMLNLPLIEDRLAARLVLYRSDDSGYIDNIELHQRDANPVYSTQERLAIRWSPIDTLILDASPHSRGSTLSAEHRLPAARRLHLRVSHPRAVERLLQAVQCDGGLVCVLCPPDFVDLVHATPYRRR